MLDRSFVHQHLLYWPFDKDYMLWDHHSEGVANIVTDTMILELI